jgi:hypothetical protein
MKRGTWIALGLAVTCAAAHASAQDTTQPEKKPEAAPAAPAPAEQPAAAPATAPAAPAPAEPAAAPAAAATTTPAATAAAPPVPAATPAAEAKPKKAEKAAALPKNELAMGLSPGAPQTATLAGGVTPAFGTVSQRAEDWRFDFHGLVLMPLRMGINTRLHPGSQQKKTVLHSPPLVPGDLTSFEYTAVSPDPWVQLNFSYGNKDVTATVIVAARAATAAVAYFNPPDQLGIDDAFLTFRLPASDQVKLSLDVGAFVNRYGNMGEYDLGRYGTPLIARVGGVGFTGSGTADLGGGLGLAFEAGMMGQLNKSPVGMEPAGWNAFADPNVGTSYAAHGHVSLGYEGKAQLGFHSVYAFVQDDRATGAVGKDGNIDVTGGDLRVTVGRFGHLYAGVGHTRAHRSRSVSGVIQVLNAPGGPGLMSEYFGPKSEGTGKLTVGGIEYDFSLGNALRYPRKFDADGPDLVLSVFGIYAHVADSLDTAFLDFYGRDKLKYGGEIAYSALRWLALSGRYDRVILNVDDAHQTHAILTPRLIFHTNWNSQDQVVLQYSHYMDGNRVAVKNGYPPVRDPTVRPDQDVVSLIAAMWW